MKLYQCIINDERLRNAPEFITLLLRRLSTSEIIAASKFKKTVVKEIAHDSAAMVKIRDKCKGLQYTDANTDIIVNVFQDIIAIAKLIQNAWVLQVTKKGKTETKVKDEARALAHQITLVEITPDNLLPSIREYASNITDSMLVSLSKPENISDLEIIIPILKDCFPLIDEGQLKDAVTRMSTNIRVLDDMVIISGEECLQSTSRGLISNGIFAPAAVATEETSPRSNCTIA